MPSFIVNTNRQGNGDFEVHNSTTGCAYMPNPANQVKLGDHVSCVGAVAYAKVQWPTAKINGCYYCCNYCHTT